MRTLVLGGTGAVGRVVCEELTRHGHEVSAAGRRSGSPRIDLGAPDALGNLARVAADHEMVVNASGVENPAVTSVIGATPFVEISATGAYLEALRAAAREGQSILLGAGLVPGLSTLMVAEMPAEAGDDLDLAVVLGSGEHHGPAAVAWTADLAGREVYDPPDGRRVVNLREGRRLPSPSGHRSHLRADFPDHLLVGARRGVHVRTYLAAGGRATTAALGLVGRVPGLAPLIRHAPPAGNARWSLTVVNRRTGAEATAQGDGQSRATGVLTAHAALALHRARPGVPVCSADLMSVAESVRALDAAPRDGRAL